MASSPNNLDSRIKLLQKYFDNDEHPTLEKFISKNQNEIVALTKGGEKLKDLWVQSYTIGAKKKNIEVVIGEPDWENLALGAIKHLGSVSPSSPSSRSKKQAAKVTPSTSSTSSASQKATKTNSNDTKKPITGEMVEEYFESLIDKKNKWTLSTGTVVEDVMKKYAITCQYEHPVHSLILDVDDKIWTDNGYFTEQEMQEIKDEACPKDHDLPKKIDEYLKGYIGKRDLESIFKQASHVPFHPRDEPDLFWIHQTFLKTLNLFYTDYLPVTDHSETDLLTRVWGVVQECFDKSEFKVRGGEKTSVASSKAKNASRSISGDEMITRKAVGRKVDLLFKSGSEEFACAEAGKQVETDTTKELIETRFICPKTLRDMLAKLGELQPDKFHELVLVGFLFSGLRVKFLLMSCPKGSVCRLQTLGSLLFPESPANLVVRLIAIITLVWRMKKHLQETINKVNNEELFIPTMSNPTRKSPIPPSFHQKNHECSKKRKLSSTSGSINNNSSSNGSSSTSST